MPYQDNLELELEGGHRGQRLHQLNQLMEHLWEREDHQVGLLVAEHGHLCLRHGCVVEERSMHGFQSWGCHHTVLRQEELKMHHLHHHHQYQQVGHVHPQLYLVQWQ